MTGTEIRRVKVQDPLETDKQREAERNVRVDPIEYMFHRGSLTGVQKQAADRFMHLHDKTRSGEAKATWHQIEELQRLGTHVDTSGPRTEVHDSRLEAQGILNEASRVVGKTGYAILVRVCSDRHTLNEIAASFYGEPVTREAKSFVSRRLKEMLDELAAHWGYTSKREPKRRIRDWATVDGKPISS